MQSSPKLLYKTEKVPVEEAIPAPAPITETLVDRLEVLEDKATPLESKPEEGCYRHIRLILSPCDCTKKLMSWEYDGLHFPSSSAVLFSPFLSCPTLMLTLTVHRHSCVS